MLNAPCPHLTTGRARELGTHSALSLGAPLGFHLPPQGLPQHQDHPGRSQGPNTYTWPTRMLQAGKLRGTKGFGFGSVLPVKSELSAWMGKPVPIVIILDAGDLPQLHALYCTRLPPGLLSSLAFPVPGAAVPQGQAASSP